MAITYHAGRRIQGTSTDATAVSGGWKELARTTLGSAGDTITTSSLADKRYYMVLGDKQSSGNADFNWRVGNGSADSGNNYARRQSSNGGSDTTNINYSRMFSDNGGSTTPSFQVGYFANKSDKEKLNITHAVGQSTVGAGNAPIRRESVNKWANTSDLIDVIQGYNAEGGDFASGSEVVVLGYDPDDTHTTNFWEELASVELGSASNSISTGTFTAKKYLWIQCYVPSSTGSADNYVIRVGNSTIDSGSNYSQRYNINGGAQGSGTQVNQDKIRLSFNIASGSESFFANSFIINNSGNEKLLISHANRNSSTGAGTAPSRYEMAGKWDNTSNQINIIELLHQNSSSSLGAGTIIKVWGSN
jgi:hypothetical protein